jgi:hypothetical protein
MIEQQFCSISAYNFLALVNSFLFQFHFRLPLFLQLFARSDILPEGYLPRGSFACRDICPQGHLTASGFGPERQMSSGKYIPGKCLSGQIYLQTKDSVAIFTIKY